MKCTKDCDSCAEGDMCLGCPHDHDKVACELAEITYFDAQEGGL